MLLASLAGAATTHQYRLEDLRLAACKRVADRVVLDRWFDQGDGRIIAMEAEAAVDLVADPAGGQAEGDCSGGRSLVRVDRALFPVNITRPGRYARWIRGFFPKGGGWLHSESMDYSTPVFHTDCDGSTAGRWVWVKGPSYDLSAGVHLLWLHNWHGGARLDKVVLAPEGETPTEQKFLKAQTPLTPARAGWAISDLLPLAGLQRLTAATWPSETRGGNVAVTVSLDGSKTTQPLQPESFPLVVTNPVTRLVLRAEVTAGANGEGPALQAPRISYELSPDTIVALEDDRVRATFLRQTGTLVGVYDKIAGVECLRHAGLAPPFALSHLLPGAAQPERVSEEQYRLTKLTVGKDSLQAAYEVAEGLRANLRVVLRQGELTWNLDLNNRSKLDIVEVTCPLLPGWRLGDVATDDRLMSPQWQGGLETSDPIHAGGGSVHYPTGGAMCWFDLFEQGHGVYLSGHDRALTGCVLGATPDVAANALTFSLTKWSCVQPRESYQGPPAVLGLHGGDWHAAADAYRTWGRTWMRQPAPPEWVREADGWYGLVSSANSNNVPFRRFPEFLKQARELGTDYISVWGQMTGGNNCDALPYPNPMLGSLTDFKDAVREIRRQGGHITFYVSSQFWRVDYGDAETLGSTPRGLLPPGVPTWNWDEWRDYALRGYGGTYSGDTLLDEKDKARYGTPWLRTIICPWTEAWSKRHLQYWTVDQYARNYGASGIYLDETSAAVERQCVAANHGHANSGIWGQSLARAMDAMVSGGRRVDPDWTFAVEGCGDAIGQFADMQLISPGSAKKVGQWGAARRFAPECYHYTFPEHILYNGVANGLYGKTADDCFLAVHLLGNRFDSFSVDPARAYVALRQRTKQLLYRARFMDNVGVSSSDEALRAKLNVLQDAGNDVRLINLANPEHKAATITVAVSAPQAWSGYYFDLQGGEGVVPLQHTAEGVSFIAPLSRASSVLLATRCEPLVHLATVTAAAGDEAKIEVMITNPLPRSLDGELRLQDAAFGKTLRPLRVALPAQSTRKVIIPVTVPGNAERRCLSTHMILTAGKQTVRRPLSLVVSSPFMLSPRLGVHGAEVTIRNQSQTMQNGTVIFSGKQWPKATIQALSLPAGVEATVVLPLEASPTEALEVQAEIQAGGQVDRQTLWVRPIILNGSFDSVGSGGRPGGWTYQKPAQAFSETVAGNSCLKLIGQPGLFVEGNQQITLLPGVTYQARCRMKRTPGAAARATAAVVLFPKSGGERYRYFEKLTNHPDEEWNDYGITFTVEGDASRMALYLYNVSSEVTVWYDDVSVTPVEPEK
ncbi:MAG: DUF6259 domain-containing protein [Armatimonadota bacterium]